MKEFDAFVGFHSRHDAANINPNIVGLPKVIGRLAEHGVGAVFVPQDQYSWGRESYAVGHLAQMTGHAAEYALSVSADEFAIAAGGIMVVRSRIRTPDEMANSVPVVNSNRMRTIGASKSAQASMLGKLMPRTIAVRPDEQITDNLLAEIPGDRIVIKADSDMASRLCRVDVAKKAAAGVLLDMRQIKQDMTFVIQRMARGHAIEGLLAMHRDDQPLISRDDPNGSYELGINCFATRTGPAEDDVNITTYGEYRVNAGRKGNTWVPVNPESLPEDATELAIKATSRLLMAEPVVAGLFSRVDIFKDQDGSYKIREMNTRDPGLDELPAYQQPYDRRHVLLADQLITLAKR